MVLTTELTDTADIDTKLPRGRGTFKSLSKIFRSNALMKLRVKLFQTLIVVPIVLHDSECWSDTISSCLW